MKTIDKWKAIILIDDFVHMKKPEIGKFIESSDCEELIKSIWEEFYLVIWWDWTMLRAIQSTYQHSKPYLGINFWTKGFLLNDKKYICSKPQKFKSIRYPFLSVKVDTWSWILEHIAFNEAQVKTAWWHLIDLNLQIWDYTKIRLKWDWILVVTPAWSTWYNVSAGGPVLPHGSKNLIATPLLTFEPRHMKPIVFENDKEVIITNNNERWYEISVYADTTPIIEKTNRNLKVSIKKNYKWVRLLIADNYEKIWNSKIYKEQWFEIME